METEKSTISVITYLSKHRECVLGRERLPAAGLQMAVPLAEMKSGKERNTLRAPQTREAALSC
jgi:hypothetical protein